MRNALEHRVKDIDRRKHGKEDEECAMVSVVVCFVIDELVDRAFAGKKEATPDTRSWARSGRIQKEKTSRAVHCASDKKSITR